MKRFLYGIMLLFLVVSPAHAEDIDVFSDCDNAVPPNVLILFDTSTSMRKQDVYDKSIPAYDHDHAFLADLEQNGIDGGYSSKDKLYYKPSTGGWWLSFKSLSIAAVSWTHPVDVLDDLECVSARNEIREKGYFNGKVKARHGECGSSATPSRIVVTGNYLNYEKYVAYLQRNISFGQGQQEGAPGFDRDVYNPNRDYYNYHDPGMGYGDYEMASGSYDKNNDHVYVQMGLTRPYNIWNDSDGIKVKDISCTEMRESLLSNGWAKGKLWEIGGSSCIPDAIKWLAVDKLLMTRNFLNYLDMKKSRRYNGIDALYDVIQARHNDVNFGIMQFDLEQTDVLGAWKSNGGDLAAPCGASLSDLKRVLYTHTSDPSREWGQPLHFGYSKSDVGKDTPLAESLVEAGLYFAGQPSWFNDYTIPDSFFETDFPRHQGRSSTKNYKSPIECPEQENHIIIITDGAPSDDFGLADLWVPRNAIYNWNFRTYVGNTLTDADESKIGDFDKDQEACLSLFGRCFDLAFKQTYVDDVAAFLHHKDLSPLSDPQRVSTHAISFRMDADAPEANEWLLGNTAKNGDGKFFIVGGQSNTPGHTNAESMQEALSEALNTIINTVVDVSTFSSAVTPVRQDDLTYSGDKTLLTSFHISSDERGKGNVKVYKREGNTIKGLEGGSEAELIGNSGVKDLWSEYSQSEAPDGSPDEGVAGVLYKRLNSGGPNEHADWSAKLNHIKKRTIYGVLGKDNGKYEVDELHKLVLGGNPKVTLRKADGTTYQDKMLKRFLAEDVYGWGLKWPLGHVVHSDVVVAKYGDRTRLFVGANDGMIHCFDMETGAEVWAVVPPNQLDRLYLLENTLVHPWFIDGQMVLYHRTKKITEGDIVVRKERVPEKLIVGERRGGSAYHLLNVEDSGKLSGNQPGYVAKIGGGADWGQSWSTPRFCQVVTSAGTKEIGFLVGGGYDTGQDSAEPEDDTVGKFVALFDLQGNQIGEKIDSYYSPPYDPSNATPIEASIIGARIIDHDHDKDRIFSRIYAGDLEGNIYQFSDELDRKSDGTWRILPFKQPEDCEAGSTEESCEVMTGNWPVRHKLFEPQDGNGTRLKQKIMYAPMYGKACGTNMVFAGTGDREKPGDTSVKNSVYAIRERWEKDPEDLNDRETLNRSDLVCFDLALLNNGNGNTWDTYHEATTVTDLTDIKGWYFNFINPGEKVISEISVVAGNLIFGTYTPKNAGDFTDRCSMSNSSCDTGQGRVYVVNACADSFDVKSYATGSSDPMPQPAVIFDKESEKILISTGDGNIIDPDLPVVEPEYWKSSTTEH